MKSSRGQALVEFAFIAPIMFIVLFAIVDFSIAIDRRLVLQHAVREGARFGAVHTNVADIQQRTVDQGDDVITTSNVVVCYIDKDSPPNSNAGNVGDAVRVKITDYSWDFPIFSEIASAFGFGSFSIPIDPSGTARLEQSVPGATACPP